MQPKNGIPPEYLLIIENNSQSLEKHGSSTSATKYITLVEGELRSKFFSKAGVAYNPNDFFLMKKDETMDEDKPLTQKMTKKILETDTETESESNKRKNIEISKQSKYNNSDQELENVSSTNSDKTNQFKLSRPKHNRQNNRNTHPKNHRKNNLFLGAKAQLIQETKHIRKVKT